MSWAAVAVGAGTAIIGGVKKHKANKQLKALEKDKPKYEIPQEYAQNVQNAQQGLTEAQHGAMQGMGAAQKEQYLKGIANTNTFLLDKTDDLKGGLRGISDISQSNTDALGKLASMDEQVRSEKQDKVIGARQLLAQQQGAMGDQKTMQWETNTFNPYAQKVASAQGAAAAGDKDLSTGLQSVAGGVAGGVANGSFKKKKGELMPPPSEISKPKGLNFKMG